MAQDPTMTNMMDATMNFRTPTNKTIGTLVVYQANCRALIALVIIKTNTTAKRTGQATSKRQSMGAVCQGMHLQETLIALDQPKKAPPANNKQHPR